LAAKQQEIQNDMTEQDFKELAKIEAKGGKNPLQSKFGNYNLTNVKGAAITTPPSFHGPATKR
jgi:hypothetical protein